MLGWAHRPNQEGRFVHQDFSVNVKINSYGLRDHEYALERTSKKRMLVLGDSYGWGFGVEHAERFDEILERRYTDWEIINASVSGYGTDQQFLYLRDKGMAYNPDVVLLLFHANDFSNNAAAEQYWYNKSHFSLSRDRLELHNTPVPKATLKQKVDRFLLGRTYFYGKVYGRWGRPILRKVDRKIRGTDKRKRKESDNGYMLTTFLIKALHELSSEHDAHFVLVSIPMNEDKKAKLREVSKALNIPYLALDEHFAALKSPVTFPHDGHWNSYGHAAAAEAIGHLLESQSILPSVSW